MVFWIGSCSDPQRAQRGLWAHEAGPAGTDLAAPHQHHTCRGHLDTEGQPGTQGLTGNKK